MWLRQALTATHLNSGAGKADEHLSGKLQACRYFFAYELPRVDQLAAVLRHGDQTCAEMPANWF